MQNRSTHGIKHMTRIQFGTTTEGKNIFREYWIHEWDEKGYDSNEHIKDLDQAIKRANEMGYIKDAKKLEQFRHGGN